MLAHDRLIELLLYDPDSGVFMWRVSTSNRVKAGAKAGSIAKGKWGYIRIRIDNKEYRGHHLAWLYVHGEFPNKQIDHINGVCGDNRILNLRLVSNAQNAYNSGLSKSNKTGYKGVHFSGSSYIATIHPHGESKYIGSFKTAIQASQAYDRKALECYGEYARTNR